MKNFYFVIVLSITCHFGSAQNLSLNELVNGASCPAASFSGYMSKKGFVPDEDQSYSYLKRKQKQAIANVNVQRFDEKDATIMTYTTENLSDSKALIAQLEKEQFVKTQLKDGELFQKGRYTITYRVKKAEHTDLHQFIIEQKKLLPSNYYVFAEDLLDLTSHENLASVFGAANVARETFFYSEEDTNKCSVLFPNTNMQVIFIWKDEVNYRDIAFLIVGGQLKAQAGNAHKTVSQNKWRSRQGISIGMSLRDLQIKNETPFRFYNWHTEQAGLVYTENSGTLNFDKLGVVLHTLDNETPSQAELQSSSEAIKRNDRIYVSTLIILPTKQATLSKVN